MYENTEQTHSKFLKKAASKFRAEMRVSQIRSRVAKWYSGHSIKLSAKRQKVVSNVLLLKIVTIQLCINYELWVQMPCFIDTIIRFNVGTHYLYLLHWRRKRSFASLSSQKYVPMRAYLHESAIPCGYQSQLYFTYQIFRQREVSFADFHICVATGLSHQYLKVSHILLC